MRLVKWLKLLDFNLKCEVQARWIAQGLTKSSSMQPECSTNEVFKVLFLWHLATLYRIWDPHHERETRARKQCTSKCWAKWQAVSKHDIKTKHSKNLICEGYLKDMSFATIYRHHQRTLQEFDQSYIRHSNLQLALSINFIWFHILVQWAASVSHAHNSSDSRTRRIRGL